MAPTHSSEPNSKRAIDLVLKLMAIPGRSGEEGLVADFVQQQLCAAGAPAAAFKFDSANRRSPHGGQIGNLIFKLPGTRRGPRRMLSAHLDTVPICLGSRPVRKGDLVRPADAHTGLGADDRSGVAVVLNTALEILERELPHPPLTFCWFVQEEIGLFGSRHVQKSLLGGPKLAFNFDGSSASKVTIGATGGERLSIDVCGVASHAGVAPQLGVSAVAIASLAIADLHRQGWHGEVCRGSQRGTSNFGIIHGGEATNVVTDHVAVRAEARSHDPAFRELIVAEIEQAFERAVDEVRNSLGARGRVQVERTLHYEAFRLAEDEPCVAAALTGVRAVGGTPELRISNGGLDANWLTAHGIPTVSLGAGQINPHMTDERLDLHEFRTACRLALHLATGAD